MSYRRWLFSSIFLFVIGLAWGLSVSPDTSGPLASNVANLRSLADFMAPLPQTSVFLFIFLKNAIAILVSFALSPFFLIVPTAALVLNGGLLGLVSVMVVEEKSLGYLLAGTLPHGIFEIPALIIGEAAAFSFGAACMLALVRKDKRQQLLPNLKQNLWHLGIALTLLVPAAFIETYLTPLLLR